MLINAEANVCEIIMRHARATNRESAGDAAHAAACGEEGGSCVDSPSSILRGVRRQLLRWLVCYALMGPSELIYS